MADSRLRDNTGPGAKAQAPAPKPGVKTDDLRGSAQTRGTDPDREERAMEDRAVTEDRVLSDSDRLELFRSEFGAQGGLPQVPPIKGYHLIWLTTTNPRDSVPMRTRIGYELVRPDEVPGWEHLTQKSGEHQGTIMVNEMILAKLRLELYESFMQELHHDGPAREQEKLTAVYDQLKEGAQALKANVIEEEGNAELRQQRQRPTFLTDEERRTMRG